MMIPQALPLPEGIRSCFAQAVNGLTMHYLEAGRAASGQPARPCLLLLHGFPELAYSWRKVMLPLAAAGFHVIAPDQRGYGATTGWSNSYDAPLTPFHMLNLVKDAVSLLDHLKIARVHAVIGHDYGSAVAGWCALTRPDIFQRVACMSAPFTGAPTSHPATLKLMADLEVLPQPRQHYQAYYGTREANDNMQHATQGLRRLAGESSPAFGGSERGRAVPTSALLCHAAQTRHGRDRGALHANAGGHCGLSLAARQRARGVCHSL
jgi:pimeloyl-ACP methyl ester carboxylesterase